MNEEIDTWIPKSAEHGIQRLVSSDSNIVSGSTHSHSPSADKTPLVLSHGMHSSSMLIRWLASHVHIPWSLRNAEGPKHGTHTPSV